MKRLTTITTLACLCLLPFSLLAQSRYSKFNYHLDQPQDTIIQMQNAWILFLYNSSKINQVAEFEKSALNEYGGVSIVYRTTEYRQGKPSASTHEMFAFDAYDRCVCYTQIFPADREYSRLKDLTDTLDFYRINDHILYSRTQDVKVIIENYKNNYGDDIAIFYYYRKEHKTKEEQ